MPVLPVSFEAVLGAELGNTLGGSSYGSSWSRIDNWHETVALLS